MRRKIFDPVDGGTSGHVKRAQTGSEDPHRREQKLYIFHIRIGFGDLLYLPNLFHTSFSSFLILMMMDLFKNRFEESYMENVGMKDRNMLTGFS